VLNSYWRDAGFGSKQLDSSDKSSYNSDKRPQISLPSNHSNEGSNSQITRRIFDHGEGKALAKRPLKSSISPSSTVKKNKGKVQFAVPEDNKPAAVRVVEWIGRAFSTYIPKQGKVRF
jgi:hypothetical protein